MLPVPAELALHDAISALRAAALALADAGRPGEALLLATMGEMALAVLEERPRKKTLELS